MLQVLLTNRYGDIILPSTLQVEEFEAIFGRVSKYAYAERAKIAEQIANIESAGASKESKDPSEQNDQSGIEKTQNSQNGNTTNEKSEKADTASEGDSQKANPKVSNTARKEAEKKETQLLRALREKENQLPEPELLQTWYLQDENSVPPVYRLQRIRYCT